jgi:hypothetical protein
MKYIWYSYEVKRTVRQAGLRGGLQALLNSHKEGLTGNVRKV